MRIGQPLALASVLLMAATEARASTRQLVVEGPFQDVARLHPVEQARAIVAKAAPIGQSLELSPRERSLRTIRLQQTHRGLPVLRRGAGVAFDANGQARFAVVQLEESLPTDTIPGIGAEQAARVARARTGLDTKASDARLVVFPTPAGARLAWIVVPSGRVPMVPYAPVLVLDAKTGDTIVRWNAVHTALARVYPANPVTTPNLIEVELPVPEGATTLSNERIRSANCIDRGNRRTVSKSQFRVCDIEQTAIADDDGNFLQEPAADDAPEDAFAEVSLFYHANRAYGYFSALGMPELPLLTTVSNLRLPSELVTGQPDSSGKLLPYQNAFYVGGQTIFSELFDANPPALFFGQGPRRDYSYDADIVYHEFGHAAIDHTIAFPFWFHADEQGLSTSPGAMHEGIADYFAAVLTGDPYVGEYMAGDLGLDTVGIRELDAGHTCPDHLVGEVHSDSVFFSAALWSIRSSLPEADRPYFDQALFDVMLTAPEGDLGFEDFAELLVASVRSSALGTAGAQLAEAKLEARGILPRCDRRILWAGEPIDSKDPLTDHTFIAPGLNDAPIAPLPYAPGIVQFRVPLEPTGHLSVTFLAQGIDSIVGTRFRPRVLVRWGEAPIQFEWSPFQALADEELAAQKMASGSAYRAAVQVPEGVETAHVMIVNAGEQQGIYKQVDFAFQPGNGDLPPSVGASDPFVARSKDGGCAVAFSGTSSSTAWLSALLLGAAALRRRRS